MPPQVSEWTNLILRWFHVAAAMLWVGATYSALKLTRLVAKDKDSASPAWLVQGGDVFIAERRQAQHLLPAKRLALLREALATWVSGFLLLGFLYYHGGLLLSVDSPIGIGAGAAIGVGVLLVGWVVYDLLWISPLGRMPLAAGSLCFLLLVALSYELNKVFSGRAMFIHIGALLGTILTANLLMRVLPAQRKIAAALDQGQPPNPALAARARLRSRHNLLLVVPVVLLMISNHFPLIYGLENNWLVLSLLVFAGGLAARIFFDL